MDTRRRYVNLIKGTAIFLMFWSHCVECCANGDFFPFLHPLFLLIYSFHMPLFMLVSGYLFFFSFRKRELKSLIIHRTQGMLQPILLGGVLNRFLLVLVRKWIGQDVSFLGGTLMPGIFDFWFLWCVLACSISAAFIGKAPFLWQKGIALLAGAGWMILFPSGDLFLCMYPFFLLGCFYGMWEGKIPGWFKKLRYLSLLIFPVLISFYQMEHSFYITPVYSRQIGRTASLMLNLYRSATGLAGSVLVMTLLWDLTRWTEKSAWTKKLLTPVTKMGENSLQLYCISTALISGCLPEVYALIAETYGLSLFDGSWGVYDFVFTPLLAAAYLLLIGGMIWLLKKTKLHSLIYGR